jgi:hypothetical protein
MAGENAATGDGRWIGDGRRRDDKEAAQRGQWRSGAARLRWVGRSPSDVEMPLGVIFAAFAAATRLRRNIDQS